MCLAWRTIGRSETCHRFLRGILSIIRGRALPLRAPASARKCAFIYQHTDWTVRTVPSAGGGGHGKERSWVCDLGMAYIDAVQWCTSLCTSKTRFVVRSFLPKVHLYGSHASLPENKRHSSFLVVHTEKRTCTPLRGYRNRSDGGRSQQWEP